MSDEVIGRNRLQDTELLTLVNYLTFGSVIRYWHPDIEKRETCDLQTGYLGNPGLAVDHPCRATAKRFRSLLSEATCGYHLLIRGTRKGRDRRHTLDVTYAGGALP